MKTFDNTQTIPKNQINGKITQTKVVTITK